MTRSVTRWCVICVGQTASIIPIATASRFAKNGPDTTEVFRKCYACRGCGRWFDDLTGTVFAGHHRPLKTWMLGSYFMGLNLSNQQIAAELGFAMILRKISGQPVAGIIVLLLLVAGGMFPTMTLGDAPVSRIELRPVVVALEEGYGVEYWSGGVRIGTVQPAAPAGVALLLPEQTWQPLLFHHQVEQNGTTVLGPETIGPLTFKLRFEHINPRLVQQTLEVSASQSQRFATSFSFFPSGEGSYSSFSGVESKQVLYDTMIHRGLMQGGAGDEHPGGQTFPVAAIRSGGRVYGILADSPAYWQNRCLVRIDPEHKELAVLNGDGRPSYQLALTYEKQNRYRYQCQMDGWQSLQPGETRRFVTWLFADQAESQYDMQLATHLALANAKGWNSSALEAILHNTAYLLLRQNLLRPEGGYLFTSGISYGWRQWITDGFWLAVGLNDPELTMAAYQSIFHERLFCLEDNAQYYLIWSALVKRHGGKTNAQLTRQAYECIRKHEKDGIFFPPPPSRDQFGHNNRIFDTRKFKTYMDMLMYDDDDAPASNQGFHCGALLAARELGFPVTEADVQRAIAGYRSMYNRQGQFMPTSLKRQQTIGQDTLYGEALTYAIFGRKLLTDEQVLGHMRTSLRIKTPYGFRIISQADGSLLPGHIGQYTFGGSWFLCDAANYLVAGLHGMPDEDVNRRLLERLEQELAYVPAFCESINTLTGQPTGNVPYSWNSGYWWLRSEFRERLGQTGVDAVETELDEELGVIHDASGLRLAPELATLRPISSSRP